MSPLQQIKIFAGDHLHLAKDALHVHVGLAVFFGSAALFHWPLRSWKPWLAVLAAALAGEAWDLRDSLRYGTSIALAGNWKDVWNGLLWPTVITLLARYSTILTRR